MPNFMQQTWFIALVCLALGWVIAKLGSYFGDTIDDKNDDKKTININSLVAQNNVFSKDIEIRKNRITELEKELASRETTIRDLETAMEVRNDQFSQTRTDLKDAVQQTQELRTELAKRAESTIRAEVHARDVENELAVLQTSGQMLDEEVFTEAREEQLDDAFYAFTHADKKPGR